MSKNTTQFYEQIKSGEQPTFLDGIKEAASTLKDIGGQIWDGAKPMFDHGRTEAAAALFSGQCPCHVHAWTGRHPAGSGSGTSQRIARTST